MFPLGAETVIWQAGRHICTGMNIVRQSTTLIVDVKVRLSEIIEWMNGNRRSDEANVMTPRPSLARKLGKVAAKLTSAK